MVTHYFGIFSQMSHRHSSTFSLAFYYFKKYCFAYVKTKDKYLCLVNLLFIYFFQEVKYQITLKTDLQACAGKVVEYYSIMHLCVFVQRFKKCAVWATFFLGFTEWGTHEGGRTPSAFRHLSTEAVMVFWLTRVHIKHQIISQRSVSCNFKKRGKWFYKHIRVEISIVTQNWTSTEDWCWVCSLLSMNISVFLSLCLSVIYLYIYIYLSTYLYVHPSPIHLTNSSYIP